MKISTRILHLYDKRNFLFYIKKLKEDIRIINYKCASPHCCFVYLTLSRTYRVMQKHVVGSFDVFSPNKLICFYLRNQDEFVKQVFLNEFKNQSILHLAISTYLEYDV